MKKHCPKCGGDMAVDYGCDHLPDRYICMEPDCDGEIELKKRIEDIRGSGIELPDTDDEDEEDCDEIDLFANWGNE
jgi:hypothetical protein